MKIVHKLIYYSLIIFFSKVANSDDLTLYVTPSADLMNDLMHNSSNLSSTNTALSHKTESREVDHHSKEERQTGSRVHGEECITTLVGSNECKLPQKKRVRGKSRGKMAQAESLYRPVSSCLAASYTSENRQEELRNENLFTDDLNVGAKIVYECIVCLLCFNSEQGARTHAYMKHILSASSPFIDSDFSRTLKSDEGCLIEYDCGDSPVARDACFLDNTVLEKQQYPARETRENIFQGSFKSTGTASLEDNCQHDMSLCTGTSFEDDNKDHAGGLFACVACYLSFPSEELLIDHMRDGISPPKLVPLVCENCSREFLNSRALAQHSKHCSALNGVAKSGDLNSLGGLNDNKAFTEIEQYLDGLLSDPVLQLLETSWNFNINAAGLSRLEVNNHDTEMKALIFSRDPADISIMLQIHYSLLQKLESDLSITEESPLILFYAAMKWLLRSIKCDSLNDNAYKGQLLGLLAQTLSKFSDKGIIDVDILSTRGRLYSASAALGFEEAKDWMLRMKKAKKMKVAS